MSSPMVAVCWPERSALASRLRRNPSSSTAARTRSASCCCTLGSLLMTRETVFRLTPRWFFEHFPGAGHRWTAAYPPYNEHLMSDVGAAFLALGVLLLMAAWMADRRVTTVVLTGLLVFSAL